MKIVIVGAGGHARVLAEIVRLSKGLTLAGFTDRAAGAKLAGLPVLGDDALKTTWKSAALLMGLGTELRDRRRALFESLSSAGRKFPALVAPSAVVSKGASLAAGVQVLTRAVVHPGAALGAGAVINTGAIVEHDCVVGAHAFIAPGAVLCGGAHVGEGALIGAGAVLNPLVKVGAGAVVGSGAVVVKDVPAGARVAGVPARSL